MKNDIEKSIRRIVARQLEMNVDDVEMDSELIELGEDSLDIIEIHTDVEYEFDIEIPNEEFEQVETVKDIVKCAKRVWKARTEAGEDDRL